LAEHDHDHDHDHDHEGHDHEGHDHEGHDHESGDSALEEMMESIRQAKVGHLIVSTVSTFASVAYGKLEIRDLPEAKAAIDTIAVLLPMLNGQVDDSIIRDFRQALTDLRLAYSDSVSATE